MSSADNDDDDKHPLLMMMLKKMLIMPVAMNDRRDNDHRQIYGSTNAPQVPPKPRPTHLPVILAARCTIPHTLLCHILYCAAYCTGQPPTLVTQRNRAQTAPPDCSQTRLKSDQKTTPGSSRYLPSTAPPHHSVTKMYIFEYIRIFSDSNSHSYFIYFKF